MDREADRVRARPPRVAVVAVHASLALSLLAAAVGTMYAPSWAAVLDPLLAAELARAPALAASVWASAALVFALVAWMLARGIRGAETAAVALFVATLPLLVVWAFRGPTWIVLYVLVAYGGTLWVWATEPGAHQPNPARKLPGLLPARLREAAPGNVDRWLAIAIGSGVLARIAAVFLMDVQWDGATYSAMGHAWARHGSFLMPWGTLVADTYTPQYSHHYPPLWPVWLGIHYKFLGFGAWQTHVAALVMACLVLVVVYVLTRDLYGAKAALGTTAVLAVEPHLVWATGTGFAENLVLLLFALTLWGVVRSLERPAFVLVAGVAAGLAYLTRSSMGPFFIIAGVGGLAWRLAHRRWRVFTDHAYMAAGALFLSAVGWWAWRNTALHGGLPWETSAYVTRAVHHAFTEPVLLAVAWAYKLPFFLFLLAPFVLFLLPGLRRGLRQVREEHESALWLAVGLMVVLGWMLAGIFWTWERSSLFWSDNRRYLVVVVLPLLWIALRPRRGTTERPTGAAMGPRTVALCGVLSIVTIALLFVPVQVPEAQAAASLGGLPEGAFVGYDGVTNRYAMYAYLPHHEVTVMRTDAREAPDVFDAIVSLDADADHPGYVRTATFTVDRWLGSDRTATVWHPAPA